MTVMATPPREFAELRPRLKLLLELYRAARTEKERATLEALLEDAFLATAWHVAEDLLANGWKPVRLARKTPARKAPRHLRLVAKDDAA